MIFTIYSTLCLDTFKKYYNLINMIINTLIIISTMLFAYFIGSISSAILICKILHLQDPRKYGSKNPGATNIFRIAGYRVAFSVALFDFLKGAIPIYIGLYFKIPFIYLHIMVIFVCIGHIYPIFFQFCGGKGVATAFGALTAINCNFFIIILTTWIILVLLFKYVSLGSIITTILMPFYTWWMQPQHLTCIIPLAFLILIRHIDNIKRLYHNQEKRIEFL